MSFSGMTQSSVPFPDKDGQTFDNLTCTGSMTRKRSRDALTKKVSVQITNVPVMMIVDELALKRRKL